MSVELEELGLLQKLTSLGGAVEVTLHTKNADEFVEALKALCDVPGKLTLHAAARSETWWVRLHLNPTEVTTPWEGTETVVVFFPGG